MKMRKLLTTLPLMLCSLSLSVSASYTPEELSQVKIDNTITLPINKLEAVESDGQLYYISDNGRFVFRGEVTDVWNKKVLTRFVDVKDSVTKVKLREMGVNPEELNNIVVGSGPVEVFSFVDPLCTYCHELMKEAKAIAGDKYTFHFIVIPALGDDSDVLARKVLCMEDDAAYSAMIDGKLQKAKVDKDCNELDRYKKTLIVGTLIGVKGVPMLIAPNGEFEYGNIDSLSDWLGERN